MDNLEGVFGAEPLAAFYGVLLEGQPLNRAVIEHFGPDAEAVLSGMRGGAVPPEYEDALRDIVIEVLQAEAQAVRSLDGRGDLGEFPITIMRSGTVFWIEAAEFDDVGYFGDLGTALNAAEANYEPFLTAARRPDDDG